MRPRPGWRPGPCRPCARVGPGRLHLTTCVIDACAAPHWGACALSEFVFQIIGQPGVGALGHSIWRDSGRDRRWPLCARPWYPQAPECTRGAQAAEDHHSRGFTRMSQAQIDGMADDGAMEPTKEEPGGVVSRRNGSITTAGALSWHDARVQDSTNPQSCVSAREVTSASGLRLLKLRRMSGGRGITQGRKYHKYDALFRYEQPAALCSPRPSCSSFVPWFACRSDRSLCISTHDSRCHHPGDTSH